jgi:hypothetical protein
MTVASASFSDALASRGRLAFVKRLWYVCWYYKLANHRQELAEEDNDAADIATQQNPLGPRPESRSVFEKDHVVRSCGHMSAGVLCVYQQEDAPAIGCFPGVIDRVFLRSGVVHAPGTKVR